MKRTPVRPSLKEIPRYTRPKNRGGKRFPKGYNPAYRAWISTLECLLYGQPTHHCLGQSEAAHVHADATGVGDVGQLIPLCRMAHTLSSKSLHVMGRHSFPAYWCLGSFENLERIAAELGQRYREEHGDGREEE
jgi:hypothetical protein